MKKMIVRFLTLIFFVFCISGFVSVKTYTTKKLSTIVSLDTPRILDKYNKKLEKATERKNKKLKRRGWSESSKWGHVTSKRESKLLEEYYKKKKRQLERDSLSNLK